MNYKCEAVPFGDTTVCTPCGLRWDTNDPDAPVCQKKARSLSMALYEKEEDQVLAIAKKIGFGRVMQLAADRWAEIDPRGALTVGPCAGNSRVESALARQLARSMELNARMKNRLTKVMQCWDCPESVRVALAPILADKEPQLHSGSQPSIYERKEP